MRKKGFTLIELIGVIVILGIILLIIMPNISGTLNRTKVNLNKEQETSLLDAARKWGTSKLTVKNGEVYLNGESIYYVTIKRLQDDGFLEDKTVKDLTDKSEISKNTKICINYKKNQLVYTMSKNNSCGTSTKSYTLTYNANGGTINNQKSINTNVKASNNVDLTKKATKEGYIFVGWNTSKVATKGLSKYIMPENNEILYAIFKKTINVTYNKDAGISAVGKTSYTCTLYNDRQNCEITLPTITASTGYTSLGWYSDNTKIGNPESKYTVSSDISLTAKSEMVDNIPPTVKFSPTSQNNYISGGKSVTVTISDSGVGIKTNQKVYYAWSNSNTVVPTFKDYFTLDNKTSVKSISVIVPSSISSSLQGTQYLWVKAGISDVKNNTSVNTVSGAFKFDNENPTLTLNTKSTTNSINVVASASSLSGIKNYEFCLDNTCKTSTNKEYTFSGLTQGSTHTITVKATSTTGGTTTASVTAVTDTIDSPVFTYSEGVGTMLVTITYPSGCSKYTCTYIKDNGSKTKVTTDTITVKFTKSGTLKAETTDGTNTVNSNYTVELKPLMSKRTTTAFWQDSYRNKIKTISIVTSADVPSSAIQSWDVSQAQDKGVMAWIDSNYNLYIGGDSGVIANSDLSSIFADFTNVTSINLTNLDTSNATNMSSMFKGDSSLTSLEISTLNTSKVTDMSSMFSNLTSISGLDITTFDTSNVTNMSSMFKGDNKLSLLSLDGINTSQVTDMSYMFNECNSLSNLNLYFETQNVTNMSHMFANCGALSSLDILRFDTSNVTDMSNMFQNCASLLSLDLTQFNTSKVTNMSYMFNGMLKLTTLELTHFDTSNVTNMSHMFFDMSSLTNLDVTSFSTSNVTKMDLMFAEDTSLTTLNVTSFNTTNVINMERMFSGCNSLSELDLTSFETSKVTNMERMFQECTNLTSLKVDNFDTSNVTNMSSMFYNCSSISELKLCAFNTSKVTDMSSMFNSDTNLTDILVSSLFTTSNANTSNMFNGSGVTSTTRSEVCEHLDKPEANFSYVTTADSITITAFTDNESEVEKYEFSKDGGKTFMNNKDDNVYTFTDLTSDTEYEIVVRETSVTNNTGIKKETVKTSALQAPNFGEEGTTTKKVTITYPTGCGEHYTCSYQIGSGEEVNVTTETVELSFTSNNSLVAKIADSKNSVSGSYNVLVDTLATVTYVKGDNITDIGKTSDTCLIKGGETSCEITLPSITAKEGYDSVGWSTTKGDDVGNKPGETVSITGDTTYYANVIDGIAPVLSPITNSSNGNWATSIKLSWTITETGSGINKVQYSNDNSTWNDLASSEWYGLTRSNNRNDIIYIRAIDRAGNISNVQSTTMKIDSTNPTVSISTTATTKSITVVTNASAPSGITKYEYSKDNGSTWVTGSSNTYTFSGLTHGTSYNIVSRVTSGSGKTNMSSKAVNTSTITSPTFSENVEGEVVITYPSGCGSAYTCTYNLGSSSSTVFGTTTTAYVGADGSLVAKVTDGVNTVNSSTYTVTRKSLYVSSSGNDSTGAGTINKPYATIGKAYNSATSTTSSTIYLLSNVTQTSTAAMGSSKTVTLTSNGSSVYTITRGSSLTSYLINQSSGALTLKNVTFDGNNVTSSSAMIYVGSKVYMESGTTLTRAYNSYDFGGALIVAGGATFTMNSGTISNNKVTAGGAAIFNSGTSILNNGNITGNSSRDGTIWSNGIITMNGGSITSNSATGSTGGIDVSNTLNINGGNINNNTTTNSVYDNINVWGTGTLNDNKAGYSATNNSVNVNTSLNNGYGLDVQNGTIANDANVHLWAYHGGNAHKWKVLPYKVNSGKIQYVIQSQLNGTQYVWVQGNSSTSGANVVTWGFHGNAGGYWYLENVGSGYYYLKNINGLCLDVYNGTVASGTNIWAFTCNQTGAQKWKFVAS